MWRSRGAIETSRGLLVAVLRTGKRKVFAINLLWPRPGTAIGSPSRARSPTQETEVTRGTGSRAAALAMVFKLVESAQARWRAVNAPHLVAAVRAGARFERGRLVERAEAGAA